MYSIGEEFENTIYFYWSKTRSYREISRWKVCCKIVAVFSPKDDVGMIQWHNDSRQYSETKEIQRSSEPAKLMATKREVSIVVPAFVLFYSGIRRSLWSGTRVHKSLRCFCCSCFDQHTLLPLLAVAVGLPFWHPVQLIQQRRGSTRIQCCPGSMK